MWSAGWSFDLYKAHHDQLEAIIAFVAGIVFGCFLAFWIGAAPRWLMARIARGRVRVDANRQGVWLQRKAVQQPVRQVVFDSSI